MPRVDLHVQEALVALDRSELSPSEQRGYDVLAAAGFFVPPDGGGSERAREADARAREYLRQAGITPAR